MLDTRSARQDPGESDRAVNRLSRFFKKQLENPSMPRAVAEAIAHAVETDRPKLRCLVADDARVLGRARLRIGDEEWIAAQSVEDGEEFVAYMRRLLGVDLYG